MTIYYILHEYNGVKTDLWTPHKFSTMKEVKEELDFLKNKAYRNDKKHRFIVTKEVNF